ncbi:hypothetical protein GLX30_30445 [Streptomyces sp. Tu 2975]|uniref:hypothetical protein n=1 Tax=Streptomyces sp. Tu 2975 TaxID=2676871 RepID=UPI001356FB4C|nr:hypothetical protein [Streptomyces sp. Tu 2975]QIP87635.1 hypothetical protein GLX30_30445 [Streptomyces sp. Tu 2975]
MSLATRDVLDAVVTHALSLGVFEQVNAHEPKNPPSSGLNCAVWTDRIGGLRSSGLSSLSARLVFSVRVFQSMQAEPVDDVDVALLDAVDALFTAYAGDFTLGGIVRNVDLMGSDGSGLDAIFGYITVDGIEYRVATITLPLLINDVWTEAS